MKSINQNNNNNSNSKKKKSRRSKKKVSPSSSSVEAAPVAMSRVREMSQPSVSSSPFQQGDARIRVKHREYIADISGSTAFSAVSYSINPGLVSTFPWLNQIAQNYESYQFRKLSFEYETYSSTATAGTVVLAVDYDASDASPSNKVELLAFHNAVRSAAWQESSFKCDVNDLKKFGVQRYIRTGALSSNLDIKTYDVGNIVIGTQGMSGSSAVGELYVTYDVDLMTPQLSSSAGAQYSAKVVSATSIAKGTPFGTAPVITGSLAISIASGTTITFPMAGQWMIVTDLSGTTIGTGATITGTATSTSVGGDFDGNDAVEVFIVKTTQAGQTWICDYTTGNTAVSAMTTRISPYLYSLG